MTMASKRLKRANKAFREQRAKDAKRVAQSKTFEAEFDRIMNELDMKPRQPNGGRDAR
jgi:hypothetical protein